MKYPNGIKNIIKKDINYKNRGMTLENEINTANEYYRLEDIAIIYKKPTPIKIVKVDYPSRDKALIKEAYFTIPSTTDYNGIYKGKYIDFEAKETVSLKGFPLINIHKHQIEHIRNIYNAKGICFLIVRFTKLNKTYLLFAKDFIEYLDNKPKSFIPIEYFKNKGYEIKDKYLPRVDYLEVLNNMEAV